MATIFPIFMMRTEQSSVQLYRKGGLDWYGYRAWQYDAALGRWHVVDPMAEKYYPSSP